uniref:Uncharacterized protein n=1 Tax=Brassica oleracea var. oleracea TaxID=109376 RepID=A0A0D3DWV2_BRAOL
MSSSSSDELVERLNEAFDDVFEDIYNNIVEAQTKKQRKRAYIERNREKGHIRLWNNYFSEDPTFLTHLFRRRFRMNKELYMRIVHRLSENVPFIQHRRDATGRCMNLRSRGPTNLVPPVEDIKALERQIARRRREEEQQAHLHRLGFMMEQHQNQPQEGEAIGQGAANLRPRQPQRQARAIGTLNDTKVIDQSPIFDDILQGRGPRLEYVVNRHMYNLAYYLTDGIYPKWSTFIQSISLPQDPKAEFFAKVQEATRKDVERAFGVLQAQFAIVKTRLFHGTRKR